MRDVPYSDRCEDAARHFVRQAAWPSIIVAIASLAPPTVPFPLRLLALAPALAVFGLSALLVFDALLFRLMGSHADDSAGGAAVDDILARMRLKPRLESTRTFEGRFGGSTRILLLQRIAFFIFLATGLAALWQAGWKIG